MASSSALRCRSATTWGGGGSMDASLLSNCVVAFRAGREERDRRADQFLDVTHVFDRLGGKLGPGARPGGGAAPAFEFLVDRLDPRLRALAGGQIVDHLAVEPVAGADLDLVEAVEHVELGQGDAVDAAGRTVWRTSTASNQPQRRLRPVTVPNSRPRSPIARRSRCPARSGTGPRRRGWCRPWRCRAHSRRAGAEARAGGGLAGDGVGRGHEGIGAVVDVEQRTLRALEEDAAAGAALLVEQPPDASI
jgi:hypothetical protein